LMALVAGAALSIVVIQSGMRVWDYRQRATWHALVVNDIRAKLNEPLKPFYARTGSVWVFQEMRRREWFPNEQARQDADRLAAYHDALRRKYEHGMRHPWLPISADPAYSEREAWVSMRPPAHDKAGDGGRGGAGRGLRFRVHSHEPS